MRSLSVLPFLVVVAACTGDLASQGSGPQCDSTTWTDTLIVSNDPSEPTPTALLGQCLQRSPNLTTSGGATCIAVVATHEAGTCACDPAAARIPVSAEHSSVVDQIKQTPAATTFGWNCFCEVPQLTGLAEETCQNDPTPNPQDSVPVDGFCYVDATVTPVVGNPDLTASCPQSDQRLLRFVGKGTPPSAAGTASLTILCEADVCEAAAGQ